MLCGGWRGVFAKVETSIAGRTSVGCQNDSPTRRVSRDLDLVDQPIVGSDG